MCRLFILFLLQGPTTFDEWHGCSCFATSRCAMLCDERLGPWVSGLCSDAAYHEYCKSWVISLWEKLWNTLTISPFTPKSPWSSSTHVYSRWGLTKGFFAEVKKNLGLLWSFSNIFILRVLFDELEDDDDMCIKFSQIEGFVLFNDMSMHGTWSICVLQVLWLFMTIKLVMYRCG